MMELRDHIGTAEKGFFHHAFFIEGEISENVTRTKTFLREEFGLVWDGNADVFEKEYEVFGVNDARELKERQSCKAATEGAKKVFLFGVHSITREAQNSLLKVFEEPTSDTCFLLLSDSSDILLPTLRSRVIVVPFAGMHVQEDDKELARAFFKASPAQRLDLVGKIIASKDKVRTVSFLNTLERELCARKDIQEMSTEERDLVRDIERFRGYLRGSAPSVKMILEHICATCPGS